MRAEIYPDSPDQQPNESPSRITGRILGLAEHHALEILTARERFGRQVIAVVQARGYTFKRLETDGAFELQKNRS